MTVILLRHASAGDRDGWDGDDRLRPLDEKGCREAETLVEELRRFTVRRVVSSPYTRCVQTVEPLAAEATPAQALAAGRLIALEDERRAAARREWRDAWERLQKRL